MTPALTAAQVGKLLGYPAQRVRSLYRDGSFPPPIDPSLPAVSWRWSPRIVEAYIDGVAVDSDPTPAHGLARIGRAS